MGILTSISRSWLTKTIKPFHFRSGENNALSFMYTPQLGLYIHIPFCRSICSFCPYCKVFYDEELSARYIRALLAEIDLVGKECKGYKKEVTSLYFGGGTPALIAEDIASIIERVNTYFVINEGIGVELHPEDCTTERLQMLKDAGVSKISIGVQSFQPEILKILGRDPIDYDSVFKAIRQVSFETVSVDFIFALPTQTAESLIQDIELAFAHGANHFAMYPFIDFTFTQRKFVRQKERDKKRLLYDIVRYCEKCGYHRDSIWTFSKTGRGRYSSMTRDNFLGFGCSATTLLEEQFKINTFDVEAYIRQMKQGKMATSLTLFFTKRQRMVYYLFWTLYSMELSETNFETFFNKTLNSQYGVEMKLAKWLKLVTKDGDTYRLTTKGSYYFHYYEHFYTLSYIDQMWSLMQKQAFPAQLIIR